MWPVRVAARIMLPWRATGLKTCRWRKVTFSGKQNLNAVKRKADFLWNSTLTYSARLPARIDPTTKEPP